MSSRIAFNSANLVGRVTNYRFKLDHWGEQHKKTAEQMTEREWAAICREVADAGFTAIEVWLAHVDPSVTDEKRARQFGRVLADHGLSPIGLAGALTAESARVCQWLNIPAANGGLWGTTLDEVKEISRSKGIRYNFENHPEKSVEEILEKIGGGNGVGVAVDTGWLGTQGVDAAATIRSLGKLVRHVHLKDVIANTHETCELGKGAVNIPQVVKTLKEMGYAGWYSWEDEPENRNPMEIASRMRQYIETLVP